MQKDRTGSENGHRVIISSQREPKKQIAKRQALAFGVLHSQKKKKKH